MLTENGIDINLDTLRAVLTAAATPEPVTDEIPVSVGMVAAGRELWLALAGSSVHVLLPTLYRAMEQRRRDEGAAAGSHIWGPAAVAETPVCALPRAAVAVSNSINLDTTPSHGLFLNLSPNY